MYENVKQIKELRDKTGNGIYDCKIALDKCYGDIELATIYLREQGQAFYRRVPFEERYKKEMLLAELKQKEE